MRSQVFTNLPKKSSRDQKKAQSGKIRWQKFGHVTLLSLGNDKECKLASFWCEF